MGPTAIFDGYCSLPALLAEDETGSSLKAQAAEEAGLDPSLLGHLGKI